MMQTNRVERRGGARPGSGRKKLNLSDQEVRDLVKEFKRQAKETGKSVSRLLSEIAYDEEVAVRVRLKAIELYYGQVMVKQTHKTVEEVKKPLLILPETAQQDSHGSEVAAPSGATDEVLRRVAG